MQQVAYNTVKNSRIRSTPTTSYRLLWAEETKPTTECCKPGALNPPLQQVKMPADCYKNAPVHWSQTGGKGRQWSYSELLTETTWRTSTMNWWKCVIQEEGTCSPEINIWNGGLLWQQESCDKMEWTLPKATPRPWRHRHEALDNIPQRIAKTCLDEIPTMDEMVRAIAGLKDGKAPGGDEIPAEL